MPKTIDLLCLGNPCADIVIGAERVPQWDDKCQGVPLGTFAGGAEANVACAASRLGWRTAAFGEVGDDANGQFLTDGFTAFGVSTRWLRRRRQSASAMTVAMVSPQGERSIVWVPMPAHPRPPDSLPQALQQSRIVYTMPYDADELACVYQAAQTAQAEVAIDVEREAGRHHGLLERLLTLCDIAFMNETGFTAAMGRPPTVEALAPLLAAGRAHTIAVTLGSRGAIAIDRQGTACAPAHPVQMVDATGAGDCFNAAFLVARGSAMGLQQCLRFACAAASRAVSAVGARSALPNLEEVQALLA
ncbi:MAG TPA: carbohydrate kinase family protein [Albitalea sp.]|nr:carbohydrate kinase family protein [Albitalea sp.]